MGFPALNAPKSRFECRKTGGKRVWAMGENYSRSEELVAKELLNGCICVTDISIRAELPTWKVSRALKRLEIRDHVSHRVEDRRKRGRPRKFYELHPGALTLSASNDGPEGEFDG
jgi:predicted ArsR family transcriptional regulator